MKIIGNCGPSYQSATTSENMKKWSKKYNLDACKNCGRSDIPHSGKGLCKNCYMNNYYDESEIQRSKAINRACKYNKANKEKRNKYLRSRYKNNEDVRSYMKNYNQKSETIVKRKKYYKEHKSEFSLKHKEYAKINRQKILESKHRYYNQNKNELLTKMREFYKENKDRIILRIKNYRLTNGKENCKHQSRIKRARKLSVNFWTKKMSIRWEWMLDATEGYCLRCGDYHGIDKLTQDHIVPLTPRPGDPQGVHHIDNVQPLCLSCNSSKHNNLEEL